MLLTTITLGRGRSTRALLFNLWFTVNRLQSASRIVAYIQLQLEGRPQTPWLGWETCLREYRKWTKRSDADGIIKKDLDHDAVPDALMYYPAIYQLHVGIAFLAVVASSFVLVQTPSPVTIICSAGTLMLVAWFAIHAVRHRPACMKGLIERNRVIWKHVLNKRNLSGNPSAGA